MITLAYSYLRFSSTEQRKGNSFDRQIRGRDAYIAKKGLTLDSSLIIEDAGVSAFRGTNAATGALRVFLDACEQKRVRSGSYLIVENLDRLSRDETLDAVMLFLGILNQKITLVTLFPEQEFSKKNLDMARLVLAVAELCRGHGESLAKSERSRSNWDKRRRNIASEILTSRKPSWIDIEAGKFVLNQTKAATVRGIFEMAVKGHGIGSIAKTLNREGVPTISKAKHWYDSYIYKILKNRACIGEFQPRILQIETVEQPGRVAHKIKRFQPIGQPLKGYYPSVVKNEDFFKGQQALKARSRTGGRSCNGVNNLFTGLTVAEDGTTYSLRPRNYHLYLVRRSVMDGLAKDVPAVPYIPFERAMLAWLREVQINVDDGGADVQALQARKEDLERRIGELLEGMRSFKNLQRAMPLLDEWETELAQVSHELELASIPRTNQLGHTQNLITLLDNADEAGRESLRRQIKQQLKLLVNKIEVRVEGKPRTKSKRVYCTIFFKNGVERCIWFQTGKEAVSDGLWTNDGTFSMEDMDAFMVKALESLDPAELPEGAAEFLEKRRRGEGIPQGTVHVKLTPLEK
jgi:DNA invertase Pin-like site-specific DNA recombinase